MLYACVAFMFSAKVCSMKAASNACVFAVLVRLAAHTQAAELVFPMKVSENQRYFVDQAGEPVFWLGTTQWQLFREYTLEEARNSRTTP